MFVYVPGWRVAGLTLYGWSNSSAVSPKEWPALNAAVLASATCGFLPNRSVIQRNVGSTGRVYIHDTRPSAKKFFERSASRGFTPSGVTASFVIDVIGIS
jgi:hypothetical protein